MPEQMQDNPIYKFMKANNLTQLDEKAFLDKYSAPEKAKEIHSFMVSNKLTDLDDTKFYDKYLKKKDQAVSLSVSSPTQSLSPDFKKGKAFAEKGFLMQPEGTKAPKEQEVKIEPVEKQGLILNTISSLDKSFAKNVISSPIKALGTAVQGVTKKVMGGTGKGFLSDNLIKFGDYLNKTIDELTPQDEEFKGTLMDQVAQAFGQVGSLIFTGGVTGAVGKGAALVSQVPKGSAAATAVKTLGSQLASPTAVSAGLSMGQAEFDRAIQAGANDDQAFEAFYKNAAVGSVLETIPVMQFFKRFNNTTGGSVANYIKTKGVAGLTGGIEEMTTEVLQQIYSNKTAKDIYNINQDILDGVGTSGGIGFGVGFVLNAMGANAKILRKQGKQQEADVLENQVKQFEDNLENPKVTSGNKVSAKDIVTQGVEVGTQKAVKNLDRDLANNVITPEQYQEGIVFAEKAAQVADKIPETVTGESRAKSIELLVERNDINQANQNLLQQKQTTDVAYHAGIDQEIKTNEERIKKIDAEVYNIAKKPSKEFKDKEIIAATEVKPQPAEKIELAEVTEEVKPTEVKALEEEYDNKSVDELIALKKKLYPSPDIESPMTPEEKLLDRVIAKKFSDKQQEIIEKRKIAEEAPRFPSYDDAQEWIKSKSKEYKSKNEFLASQEYKDALPDINALFKVEKADYSKKAKAAMQESGVKIGDRVMYDYVTPIGVETYSGQIVDRQGVPFVRFDNNQKTISGKQSVRWHKGFIKESAPKSVVEQVKPTEVKEIKPKEIFPETIVENVLYHDSDIDNLTEFKNSDNGIFVTGDENWWQKGKNKYQVAINVKNPKIVSTPLNSTTTKEFFSNPKNNEYDAIVTTGTSGDMSKAVYAIRDASQIKVLGKNIDGRIIKSEVKPTEVKEKVKTAKVAQPELAPTPKKEGVKEKKESFTTKSGRQKVEYEKGQLIVRDIKTGKEVSPSTRKKALDEYIDKFDFNKGERFTEVVSEVPSGLSDEEGKRFIIENSKNPLEVLETYVAEPKESKLTTEEQLIADYGLGKLTQKGFERFGDENLITGGMALTYFNKEGTPIDVRAKEMSDYYGKEITPQDIVNFMIAYPSGASQAVKMGETRVAREAAEKFKELTGIDLNSTVAEKIIDAEIAKAEAFEQELIKQEYETREQLEAEYYKASEEADRLAEEGDSATAKPAKKAEKTTETELAKEYKEAVGKASKKAKENAKKDFVDRNFDNIVEKLKIQIKCPT